MLLIFFIQKIFTSNSWRQEPWTQHPSLVQIYNIYGDTKTTGIFVSKEIILSYNVFRDHDINNLELTVLVKYNNENSAFGPRIGFHYAKNARPLSLGDQNRTLIIILFL